MRRCLAATVVCCLVARLASSEEYRWSAPLVFVPCFVAGTEGAAVPFPAPEDCVSGNPSVGFEFGCCHIMSAYASHGPRNSSVVHVLLTVHDLYMGRDHPITGDHPIGPLALRTLWGRSTSGEPFPRGKGTDEGRVARAVSALLPPLACDFSAAGHSAAPVTATSAGALALLPLYLGVASPVRVLVATCPLPTHVSRSADGVTGVALHLRGIVGTYTGHPIGLRPGHPSAGTITAAVGPSPRGGIFMYGGLVHHGVERLPVELIEDAALFHRHAGVDTLRLYINDDGTGGGDAATGDEGKGSVMHAKRAAADKLTAMLRGIAGVEAVLLRTAGHQIRRASSAAGFSELGPGGGGGPEITDSRMLSLLGGVGCVPGGQDMSAASTTGVSGRCSGRRFFEALDGHGFRGTRGGGAAFHGASAVADALAKRQLRRGSKVAAQYRLLQDALYAAKHLRGHGGGDDDDDDDWFLQADVDEVFAATAPATHAPPGQPAASLPTPCYDPPLRRLLNARAPPDADFVSVRSRKVAHALPSAPLSAPAAPPSVPYSSSPLAAFSRCFRSPTDLRGPDACDAPLSWLIGAASFDPPSVASQSWGVSLPPLKRAAATDGLVLVDVNGRLDEQSALGRAKWHTKYAARTGRVEAALVHAAWGKEARPPRAQGEAVDKAHRRDAFGGEAVGVDAAAGDLAVYHYRLVGHGRPSDPAAVCASIETAHGCGASGRTANATCGRAWCCLVGCDAVARAWGPQERKAAAQRFAKPPAASRRKLDD